MRKYPPRVPVDLGAERVQRIYHVFAEGFARFAPISCLLFGELSGETEVLLPEEAVDRVTALKMATTWASEYMMAEDTVGTLEPGKYADFAVLDRDFFTIDTEEILDTTVVMTGLSGQIVYDNSQ